MTTDTELRIDGPRVLVDALGPVDVERLITLVLRKPVDYTNWQRQRWMDKSWKNLAKGRWNNGVLRRTRVLSEVVWGIKTNSGLV